jgi:ribosomal protein L22
LQPQPSSSQGKPAKNSVAYKRSSKALEKSATEENLSKKIKKPKKMSAVVKDALNMVIFNGENPRGKYWPELQFSDLELQLNYLNFK